MVWGFDCYSKLEISTMLNAFTVCLIFEFGRYSVDMTLSSFIHSSYSNLHNFLKKHFSSKT